MTLECWLNGKFVPVAEAKVSAFDAGMQHGVGLLESMQARGGRVVRMMQHLERLQGSASELGLAKGLRIEPLADAVELTLKHNQMEDARIRITLTAGDLNMLAKARELQAKGAEEAVHAAAEARPTIIIQVQPPTVFPREMYEKGISVRIAKPRLNNTDPFAGHKTLNYWPRLKELQDAAREGYQESLWFDLEGNLACGCVSNVFVVKDGVIRTPWARGEVDEKGGRMHPVLPGVTREAVLAVAQERGKAIERTRISGKELLEADEVFLTNSVWDVISVCAVAGKAIADGGGGQEARKLATAMDK